MKARLENNIEATALPAILPNALHCGPMVEWVVEMDKSVFFFVNHSIANALFDWLLPLCRERWIWAPFYLFVLAFCWVNLPVKRAVMVFVGLAITIAVADSSSNYLFKKNVQRTRPCNDTELVPAAILRIQSCGSGYSFTSSHATNHFAIAVFLSLVFGSIKPWIRPVLLAWATLIAFSQVYVGVHYPLDVTCGGLLGWLCGHLGYFLVGNRLSRIEL